MFSQKTSKLRGRKPLWLAIVVAIIWMSISGVTGPLFGKLSTVQENNNSSFLPPDSEATRAATTIAKFSDSANDQIPALVLFTGDVNVANIAATQAFAQTLGSKLLVHSDGKLITDAKGKNFQYLFPIILLRAQRLLRSHRKMEKQFLQISQLA